MYCTMQAMKRDVRVLLSDIRSAHNVGAMFRTADAAGVSRIYISGFTPAPLDRFGRQVKEIAKTALGAEQVVAWETVKAAREMIEKLKDEGFSVVGIEQDERAVDYRTFELPLRALVLVGSEVEGLSQELRDHCDTLLEIPMRGKKESLNVSVAFGIALFRMLGI
jgi:tRNA G18 (ribose-2'-O)-methylase SpoU